MVAPAQPEQGGADERPPGQVEGPPRLLGGQPHGLGLAPIFGEPAQVHHVERQVERLGDHLDRAPVDHRERGPQRFVPPDDLPETPFESVDVERPLDPDGGGHVEGRLAGRQLIEEPERLLRERERRRAGPLEAPDRLRLPRMAPAPGVLDPSGQRGHGGRLEEHPERDLDREGVAEPRGDLGGQQRVAAPLEEVVEGADPVQAEHRGPDARHHLLGRRARGDRLPVQSGPVSQGAGRALRSTLPLGDLGSASSATNADGTIGSGSLRLRNCRSSEGVGACCRGLVAR